MTQPKTKKIGRPKLPKGEAKGQFVGLRLNAELLRKISIRAKGDRQTVSQWIRSKLETGVEA